MKRGRSQRRRPSNNINRAMDSSGPEVRIRGTANQIYDKYLALARDAQSSGDRIKAESYLQHAEHYFRVIRSIQAAQQAQQPTQQSPAPAADGEGEQPDIGDSENARPRGRRQQANGADHESESTAEPTKESGAEDAAPEPKKPRRRRARRTAKDEGEDAASEKGAAEPQAAE